MEGSSFVLQLAMPSEAADVRVQPMLANRLPVAEPNLNNPNQGALSTSMIDEILKRGSTQKFFPDSLGKEKPGGL